MNRGKEIDRLSKMLEGGKSIRDHGRKNNDSTTIAKLKQENESLRKENTILENKLEGIKLLFLKVCIFV